MGRLTFPATGNTGEFTLCCYTLHQKGDNGVKWRFVGHFQDDCGRVMNGQQQWGHSEKGRNT